MGTPVSKGIPWRSVAVIVGIAVHAGGCGGSVSGTSTQASGDRDAASESGGKANGSGGAVGAGGDEPTGSGGLIGSGGAKGQPGSGGAVVPSGGSPSAGGSTPSDGGLEGGFVFNGGPCLPCFTRSGVSWGPNGGFVAYTDVSSLSSCTTYTHRRDPVRTTPPSQVCTTTLRGCPDDDTLSNAQYLLSDFTFEGALANDMVYGLDRRAVDGQVFRISVDMHTVDVGDPCAGASGCIDPPPPVKLLVETLKALDSEGLHSSECVAVFGTPP